MRTNKPQYIVVHTAAYDGPITADQIDGWHKARGFKRNDFYLSHDDNRLNHIGYHWYIRSDGTMVKGRWHSEIGAHCRNESMNHKSIGICFEGHGDIRPFTIPQLKSFYKLSIDLCMEFPEILRKGTTGLIGHREARGVRKSCPGTQVDMESLRRRYNLRVLGEFGTRRGLYESLGLEPMPLKKIAITSPDTTILPRKS